MLGFLNPELIRESGARINFSTIQSFSLSVIQDLLSSPTEFTVV